MAKNAVELTDCEVASAVGTPGKVTATATHVRSTVTGSKVRLTDCVVRGNVVGSDVILENCVVLGLVAGERSLDLKDTLCYTFKSYGEARLSDAEVVLPQAVTDGSVTLETPVTVLGVDDDHEDEHTSLTRHDLVTHDGTQYLTLADRVLNLEAVRERIDDLETELQAAVIEGVGTDQHSFEYLGLDDLPEVGVPADGQASVPDAGGPDAEGESAEDEGGEADREGSEEADVGESAGDDADGQDDTETVDAEPVDVDEAEFFDEADDGEDSGATDAERVEEDEEEFFDL